MELGVEKRYHKLNLGMFTAPKYVLANLAANGAIHDVTIG